MKASEIIEKIGNKYADISTQELRDQIAEGEMIYDETWSQYMSEKSLFGDAWPGAQLDLERIERVQDELKAELAFREACNAPPESHPLGWDDIEF